MACVNAAGANWVAENSSLSNLILVPFGTIMQVGTQVRFCIENNLFEGIFYAVF